jgi:RNA polymerase sigma factor for flagellar operon FliA
METLNPRAHGPRDRLICNHADVAKRIALKMARRCPTWIAREDLVAAGMIGLIEAADRYDDSREEPFITFAEHRIRGAVLDELRRGDMMPRRVRALARKIAVVIAKHEQASGAVPTDQTIASELGVTVETYRQDMSGLLAHEIAPLHTQEATLAADSDAWAPDVQADYRHSLSQVNEALGSLPPRDVKILAMHYLEELTYQQIAGVLGITPSRVCQLLWRAVDRLRDSMGMPALAA